MLQGVWATQWANLNSQRKYPLADTATGLDVTGNFKLPDEFIIFLDLPVNMDLDVSPERFFVRKIGAFASGYSIVVAYDDGDNVFDVATSLLAKISHRPGNVYNLIGMESFVDTSGRIVIGRLEEIDAQPPGLWEFDLEGGRLDPDAVRPMLQGVSGVVIVNGSGTRSQTYTGLIELEAGDNIQISAVVEPGQPVKLIFSAVGGSEFVERCLCLGDAVLPPPIRRINGRTAGPDRNFNFLPGTCIEIQGMTNGLKLSNPCAEPCCDCKDLQPVVEALKDLQQQAGVVQGFAQSLQAGVTSFIVNALGARLSDRGCHS